MPYFPQIDDLQNFIYRCIENYTSGRHFERHGICSSYDPKTHTGKFIIQPEGVETGDVPIEVDHVGKGWGILVGPTPGTVSDNSQGGGSGSGGGSSSGGSGQQQEPGDQFIVRYQEGDFSVGKAARRVHDNTNKPPKVQSKEILVQNKDGHHLFFKVEQDGKTSIRLAHNNDTSGNTPQPEQPPPETDQNGNSIIGTFKFDEKGNQTSDSNQKTQTVTDSGGATQTHDGQGNYTHTAKTITHNSTKGNIVHTASNNSTADIIHTALTNITHTAQKGNITHTAQQGNYSRTAQNGTITDTAQNIGHNGPTNVQGTLGVSQLLSANGGANILGGLSGSGGMSMGGLSQLLGGMQASGGSSMSGGTSMSGGASVTGGLTADTATITPTTVSNLPAASASQGMRVFVTDSTLAGATHFGSTVTGGGTNPVPVWSDGTNWLIG